MIVLICLLLSVITVAPKSIQQKAAGNAEQRARKLDEGPATLESWDKNGEEQVLQKMLQIRQEADSELIQAEREAADPQADTSRQDWLFGFGGSDEENSDEENLVSKFQRYAEEFLNSDTGKGLKKCLEAAGEDVLKAGISWMKKQFKEKLGLKRSRDQEIEQSQAKENEQEAFNKVMEELIQAEREAADPQTNLRQQGFVWDTIKGAAKGFLSGNSDEENPDEENSVMDHGKDIMDKAMKCASEHVSAEKLFIWGMGKLG